MDSRFSITTPIYYINNRPHIGHAYTTIVADALTRWHRLFGKDTWFLTGTDEHGQKVERTAKERGMEPKAHADDMIAHWQDAFKKLGLSYDRFIRTTDPDHIKNVQALLKVVYDQGDIYVAEYKGYYNVPDETFVTREQFTPEELQRGDVIELTEKNYFFKLEEYRPWLIDFIKSHPNFILPEERANWVLAQLREPIPDLCISRPKERLSWGIPLPFDDGYVCYVWFDALLNYLSGMPRAEGVELAPRFKTEEFLDWWPADVQLIGKEILQHHAIYWPIMLYRLGLPMPTTIYAHGWLLNGDRKISKRESNASHEEERAAALTALADAKSSGNREAAFTSACEALMSAPRRATAGPGAWLWLADDYGTDAFRYFLLRDVPFGQDSQISLELFLKRVNADLANNLGNLLSRSSKIVASAFDNRVPPVTLVSEFAFAMEAVAKMRSAVHRHVLALEPHLALDAIIAFLRDANQAFALAEPWNDAKTLQAARAAGTDAADIDARLSLSLRIALESVANAALLMYPVLPTLMDKVLTALPCRQMEAARGPRLAVGSSPLAILLDGEPIGDVGQLFPRLDPVEQAQREFPAAAKEAAVPKRSKMAMPAVGDPLTPSAVNVKHITPPPTAAPAGVALIGIDDVTKMQLRTAIVLEARAVENSNRLLRLTVSCPEDPNNPSAEGSARTIVAGIAQHYTPEALLGKRIVIVANLKPAKLMGIESHGMLLAAKAGGKLSLITTDDKEFFAGAVVG